MVYKNQKSKLIWIKISLNKTRTLNLKYGEQSGYLAEEDFAFIQTTKNLRAHISGVSKKKEPIFLRYVWKSIFYSVKNEAHVWWTNTKPILCLFNPSIIIYQKKSTNNVGTWIEQTSLTGDNKIFFSISPFLFLGPSSRQQQEFYHESSPSPSRTASLGCRCFSAAVALGMFFFVLSSIREVHFFQ